MPGVGVCIRTKVITDVRIAWAPVLVPRLSLLITIYYGNAGGGDMRNNECYNR